MKLDGFRLQINNEVVESAEPYHTARNYVLPDIALYSPQNKYMVANGKIEVKNPEKTVKMIVTSTLTNLTKLGFFFF